MDTSKSSGIIIRSVRCSALLLLSRIDGTLRLNFFLLSAVRCIALLLLSRIDGNV